ncbi:hypothetical protein AX14_009170 [Amanita brunnescens Koide BX004]|nr:hypothetical protein AX14_009170 [Amanita brunnescens Koide BX004]
MHHEPHSVAVYTDGAFHHDNYRAAFAFTIFQNGIWHDQYDWCPAASSFDAELRAIEAALTHVITRNLGTRITLFVDNKAAANSLFNFDVKSSQPSVVRINMLLDAWFSENPQRSLVIRFTPSHQGITSNERADELTKAGLRLCPTNPPQILRSHFLSQHKRRTEHDWQQRWKDVTYRGSQWLPIRRKKKVFKPSFAPHALLNTMGKLLTKIIAARMQFDCLKYDILHPGQCGGVAMHATVDAGSVLASFVAESRELGLHATTCTFDIAQFFPSLSHRGCALILGRFGFSRTLIKIFNSYFTGRITRYKWDSATSGDFDFHRILNSYHHLPHLDKPTFKPLNAPSPW